jgi:predicted Zn-dependent peptidase
MKITVAFFALFSTLSSVSAAELSVPHEMYTLENGLTVILSEDHDLPIVQVNVWYHVGSKDEPQGRSGFAHLFEHLMFQGSEHNPGEYFEKLQAVGARVNGTTNTDRTNYFEGVPAEHLPLALWLEADRMGWLLGVLDMDKLNNQREVVKNERRQNYEVPPYGAAWGDIMDGLYPEGHPYHHLTIGTMEDLSAATIQDVTDWFQTWYGPNNASLAIVGDFDPQTAKGLVEKYFGPIASGPQPELITVAPNVLAEKKVLRQVEAGVPFEKVWMVWNSPALWEAGDAELDVMSSALSSGKDSRLHKKLVHELQIAKSVEAYQVSRHLAGAYMVEATAAAGHTTDELVEAIEKVLADFVEEGPSLEEVANAKTQVEVSFYGRMRTVRQKANALNSYLFFTGKPDSFQADLNRYTAVEASGVKDWAAKVLIPERLELHIRPPTEEEAAAALNTVYEEAAAAAEEATTPTPSKEGGAE